MHQSSRDRMERFAELCSNYFKDSKNISVADIGGVGTSYRDIFEYYLGHKLHYVTINVKSGIQHHETSCNILLNDIYDWKEISDNYFDVVISGQTFEHIEYPFITILQMRRILKNHGWLCIIAPSHWFEHPAPLDTFRYYNDGMKALAKFAGLHILYSRADHPKNSTYWHQKGDAYLIAQKSDSDLVSGNQPYNDALLALYPIIPSDDSREITRSCTYTQSSSKWEKEQGIGRDYNLLSGNFTGEYAVHTAHEQDPSVIINLKRTYFLRCIRLFNRKGFEARLRNLSVYISLNLHKWDIVKKDLGIFGGIYDARPLTVPINAEARYILLQNNCVGVLHLDQVQVFAS